MLSEETLRGAYGDSYSPINFGGIYLPLLWDSVDCVKSPLVIGYSNGHFTAVVSIEDGKLDLGIENQPAPSSTNCTHAVPLVKYDGMPLPVHFLHDREVPLASDRLRQYLDCAKVPFSSNPGETRQAVLVAKLNFSEQPRCMKDLIDGYFMKAREEHQRVARHSQLHPQNPPGTKQPALQIVECQTQDCSFYGSTETGNRCSQCLNEYLRTLGPACEPSRHVAIGQIPSRQQHVVATAQQLQAQNASMSQQHTVTSTQPPSNAGMVSSSLTLPAASSVKCRTTECKYGAMTGRGGLCERCFEAERSAEEMAASMNYMNLASTKHCSNKVNGCEFFGLPEHHNLCSRCYRTFCLHMESTLGMLSPTGLPPSSPTPSTPPNQCQNQHCPSPGVPALYGMCVQCYTGCIHAFITSEGSSVGSVAQVSPCLQSPPANHAAKQNLLPTGGGRTKGVLCASPGCCNEGIHQFSDLCRECYARKSGPSPRNTPISTSGAVSFPVAPPPQSSMSALASAAPTHQLTSALTSAISYCSNCSNPSCRNQIRSGGSGFCQQCERLNAAPSNATPTASLQQPSRLVGRTLTTASSIPPRQSAPAYTSALPQTYTTPGASSFREVGHPHQVAAPQAPSTEANTGACVMGCRKPAVQEGGLCEQCYTAAYQLELQVNRQTVPQPSRQQGAVASAAVSNNQVCTHSTDTKFDSFGR